MLKYLEGLCSFSPAAWCNMIYLDVFCSILATILAFKLKYVSAGKQQKNSYYYDEELVC